MPPKKIAGIPAKARGPPIPAASDKKSVAVKKKPKKKAAAYGLAAILPEGEKLTDCVKIGWKLGKAFAKGGFGRIYDATPSDSSKIPRNATAKQKFVVKMEPYDNGPLYQEMHVYMGLGKTDTIAKWKKAKHLDFLGIPEYFGSGLHERDGEKYRFLVIGKFGKDLESLREKEKKLSPAVVFALSENCLNALHYIHDQGYVHADLKAENLLLEYGSNDFSRMMLTDFGLAKRVTESQSYKEDPKQAHNGTLVFTSLDAHRGCKPSFRGDVEILGYNIVYWLYGHLPWFTSDSAEESPERVFAAKQAFAKDVGGALKKLTLSHFAPHIAAFFRVVYNTEYTDKPDYDRLRQAIGALSKEATAKAPRKTLSAKKKTPQKPSTSHSPLPKRSPSSKKATAEDDKDSLSSSHLTVPTVASKTAVTGRNSPRQRRQQAEASTPSTSERRGRKRKSAEEDETPSDTSSSIVARTPTPELNRKSKLLLSSAKSANRLKITINGSPALKKSQVESSASQQKHNKIIPGLANLKSASTSSAAAPVNRAAKRVVRKSISTSHRLLARQSINSSFCRSALLSEGGSQGGGTASTNGATTSANGVIPGARNMASAHRKVAVKKKDVPAVTMATQTSPGIW